MKLEIDIPEHHYNNIMALDSVSLGRVPYKGIIMYSINAIKHGKVLDQEPTTKNCESCRYYGSHHEVCNYCYECSLWTEGEPTTKNNLAVDAVSRNAVINQIFYSTDNNGDVVLGSALRERIARLPSVTPQESKTGYWTYIRNSEVNGLKIVECSECGKRTYGSGNYCHNCGAKMVEPESED